MTTEIAYSNNGMLVIQAGESIFICGAWEFNRRHEGVWNSRVLAFVPQRPEDKCSDCGYNPETGYLERCPKHPVDVPQNSTHFSDGTPVSSYEQFN